MTKQYQVNFVQGCRRELIETFKTREEAEIFAEGFQHPFVNGFILELNRAEKEFKKCDKACDAAYEIVSLLEEQKFALEMAKMNDEREEAIDAIDDVITYYNTERLDEVCDELAIAREVYERLQKEYDSPDFPFNEVVEVECEE